MWTRKELKDRAKASFKTNYWKAVLVGVLLMITAGGLGGYFGNAGAMGSGAGDDESTVYLGNSNHDYDGDYEEYLDNLDEELDYLDGYDNYYYYDLDEDGSDYQDDSTYDGAGVYDTYSYDTDNFDFGMSPAAMVLLGLAILFAVLLVTALVFAIEAFLVNPLEVGCQRFFVRNLHQKAEVKELAHAFDHNYLETVKTMFLRDIFILLWSLLLIIPGIVKAYEYRMIPYLLAEDPTMTKDVAFAESKRMMTGQKWNAFVLDLSFLGWNILSALTMGILAVFYVAPYQALTNAALYEKLRYGMPDPGEQVAGTAGQPPVAPVAAEGAGGRPFASAGYAAESIAANTATTAIATAVADAPAAATATNAPVVTAADASSQPPIAPYAALAATPYADPESTKPYYADPDSDGAAEGAQADAAGEVAPDGSQA